MDRNFGPGDLTRVVTRPGRKTRIFISYARTDLQFATKLVKALELRGFEAFLDKRDILPGEDWRGRLMWSRLFEQIFRVDKWSLCRG